MGESGVGRSVLFVDDEPAIRAAYKLALTTSGFEFDEAADGNEALNKLAGRTYDAVVTDIIMPDKEGIETILEIRRRWPNLFVIAISGGGRVGPQDFLKIAGVCGADRTLSKPFKPSQLISALLEGPAPRAAP